MELNLEEYYVQNFDYFEMAFHKHVRLEIMLVITGSCHVLISEQKLTEKVVQGSSDVKDFQLKSGDYILLFPGISHQLLVKKGQPCRMISVEFGLKSHKEMPLYVKELSANVIVNGFEQYLKDAPSYVLLRDLGVLRHTLIQLIQEKGQKAVQEDSNFMVDLLTKQTMVLLGRDYISKAHESEAMKYVKKAVDYLNKHFEEMVEVQEVANYVGVSCAYLQRLFKIYQKITMTDYIIEKRLEKAKILLDNTTISVSDICFLVGFNHRQYFTQQFTMRNGLSPKQYRKSHLNQWAAEEVNRFVVDKSVKGGTAKT